MKNKKPIYKKVWFWLISIPIVLFLIIGVPLIINKCYIKNEGFPTVWGGSDVLAYYGAALSFIGTVILSTLALWQNQKANEINKILLDKELSDSVPFANINADIICKKTVMDKCATTWTNIHSIESTNVIFIENVNMTEEQVKKRHFIEYLLKFTCSDFSNSRIKKAFLISDSIHFFDGNSNPVISTVIHATGQEQPELLINWENDSQFSFYIKVYAVNQSFLEHILENDNMINITFSIKYISSIGTYSTITHQLWIEKENDRYKVLGVRNTEINNK